VHPIQRVIQNQYYDNHVPNLEIPYDELKNKFHYAQAVTDQNFTTINDNLNKMNKVLDQLSKFIAKIHSHSLSGTCLPPRGS
jgi:hypothetical protein